MSDAGILVAAQGMSTMSGAYGQSQSILSQSTFQSQQLKARAGLERLQAGEALDRGGFAAGRINVRTDQVAGQQRLRAAVGGVTTPTSAINETLTLGAQDADTARMNAWREAWGLDLSAKEDEVAADFASKGGQFKANMTMATGGMQAIGQGMKDYRELKLYEG
jgi:hypothetical protein